MALSTRESQRLWRQHNRLRTKYYRRYRRDFTRLYAAQGDSIIEAWKIDGAITMRDMMPKAVDALFTKLYVDTGSDFAKGQFLNTKADTDFITLTWEEQMAKYAQTYGAASIESINATNLAEAQLFIKRATEQALLEGLSVDQTTRMIEKGILKQWRHYGKFSAERIARTEVVAASNVGAFEGALSTGLKLKKVWLTALDERARVAHANANGQSVDMHQPFIVGGENLLTPGAKTGSAGNVINCRCAVGYTSDLTA